MVKTRVSTSSFRYLPTLDGWRAVAITAVIVSHAKRTSIDSGFGDERILHLVSYGRLGVDLFFAISGFLICSRLLDEERLVGSISLKEFYLRRTFRILPLYFAYLAILSLLALVAKVPVSRAELLSCVFFYRNYEAGGGIFTNHFWSLSVEEHFYFVWPLFLLLAGARRALWVTPMLGIFIHCWRSLDTRWHLFARIFPDPGILFRTDTRIDALLWGCFAALIYDRYSQLRIPPWGQWTIISVFLACITLHAPALPLIFALFFPLLIVSTVTCPESYIGRFLELQPLRWVGRLSFSLYVWQTLFLQGSPSVIPSWLMRLQQWPANLCMILLSSVVSHYMLERPMIRLGRSFVGRPIESHLVESSILVVNDLPDGEDATQKL